MRNKKGKTSYLFKNKKGQGIFGMGFGMIFSIILIIFFIAVAFIVIRSFLETKNCAQIGIFAEEFQTEIDKTWNSQSSNFEFKGRLPTKIKYVCFADLSRPISATGIEGNIGRELGVYEGPIANMYLYPPEPACNMVYHEINHLDLDEIISQKNPYCFNADEGNIKIQIEKDFNEKLVRVS